MHWSRDAIVDNLLTIFERVNQRSPDRHAALVDRASQRRVRADAAPDEGARRRLDGAGRDVLRRRGVPRVSRRAESARRTPPVVTAKKIGVAVGAGTDAHRVASYNPFTALQWFLDGKTVGGVALRGPEETPDRAEALRFYTIGSAWFSHDDDVRGSLEVGKLADLAVLSQDYMTVPVDRSARSSRCSPWSAARSCTRAAPFK